MRSNKPSLSPQYPSPSRSTVKRRDVLKALAAITASAILPKQGVASTPKSTPEWTLMVYINAKNNLEPNALDNFHSIASVGSTNDVNIIVELGRPEKIRHTQNDGNWSGVYRFYMEKDLQPLPENGMNVASLGETTDMGSTDCLRNFVRWGKKQYPAKRYALVIWNHGQGWRFQRAADPQVRAMASGRSLPTRELSQVPASTPALGGYRAVSSDDDTGSILYNRQIQEVVEAEFNDNKLDLLGYDACLMAMLETAYAFSPSVDVMVASQELEPAAGWDYEAWIMDLIANPAMSTEQLGSTIVDSYARLNRNRYMTTLSAISLAGIRRSSRMLSAFADDLRQGNQEERAVLLDARSQLRSYGDSINPPLRYSVDLIGLLRRYEARTKNLELRAGSAKLRAAFERHIVLNYASTRSARPYGSEGIAIYFPEDQEAFNTDFFKDGYLKSNRKYPVDFVINETWPDLLYVLLGIGSAE